MMMVENEVCLACRVTRDAVDGGRRSVQPRGDASRWWGRSRSPMVKERMKIRDILRVVLDEQVRSVWT